MATELRIEFGRTRLRREEIAKLRSGSVITLNNLTAEPADLYAGGQLVARGEPIVVDGRFAVRVLQLAESQEARCARACGRLARAQGTV
jgi:flagellar motor switch protein FliN/FliY